MPAASIRPQHSIEACDAPPKEANRKPQSLPPSPSPPSFLHPRAPALSPTRSPPSSSTPPLPLSLITSKKRLLKSPPHYIFTLKYNWELLARRPLPRPPPRPHHPSAAYPSQNMARAVSGGICSYPMPVLSYFPRSVYRPAPTNFTTLSPRPDPLPHTQFLGIDGFRLSYLESVFTTQDSYDHVPTALAEPWKISLENPASLPGEYSTPFSIAHLTAVEGRKRSIAVGSTLRRVFGSTRCTEYKPLLPECFSRGWTIWNCSN